MVRPLRGYALLHYPPRSSELLRASDHFLAIPSVIADAGAPLTGDQLSRIAMEIPNILEASQAALSDEKPSLDAVRGLVRFSARTDEARAELAVGAQNRDVMNVVIGPTTETCSMPFSIAARKVSPSSGCGSRSARVANSLMGSSVMAACPPYV